MSDPDDTKAGLRRLKLAMVDDLLKASDQGVLAQFTEDFGSAEANAKHMREAFEKTILLANKDRLHAARAGVSASRVPSPAPAIPIAEARARLRQVMAAHADDQTFTLAARKESELTDADVLDMLEAMRDLGLIE
ncbi:hypothetical protein G6321_00002040 (plasmid) [Bradyrhizobium barranii subsp. barranii]|uniref:Uncharacterized protein n=1 Tax=Bradyrhizobium barranii subsp. barranii TaxID=2823807 RepID=A0A7Z0QNQ9_9BRAD|nr:hypothetical protein [Bradyrhizobium barranii]UGX89564.1 hypothetical protein G6321_00002040 [Bradyrhizobium barranii subsp. barranii]